MIIRQDTSSHSTNSNQSCHNNIKHKLYNQSFNKAYKPHHQANAIFTGSHTHSQATHKFTIKPHTVKPHHQANVIFTGSHTHSQATHKFTIKPHTVKPHTQSSHTHTQSQATHIHHQATHTQSQTTHIHHQATHSDTHRMERLHTRNRLR